MPRASARSRPGLEVHASRTLTAPDVTAIDNIPCTTLARTLLDRADVLGTRELERANGHRGAGRLRRALDAATEPAHTESELEEAFLELCHEHGLPRPQVAVWPARSEGHLKADFVWRVQRLVAETDGYAFHRHRRAFERDHRRDALPGLAGWRVRRFTWRQIVGDAQLVAATVRATLGEPG